MTTEIDMESLSDEERAALEGEDAGTTQSVLEDARTLEKDDGADGDDTAAAEAAEKAAREAKVDGEEGDPAPAADAEDPVVVPPAPKMSAPDTTGYDEARSKLLDERKDLRSKYRAGDLDADAYDEAIDQINEKIAKLDGDRREANLAAQFNADMETQRYLATVAAVKTTIKERDGVDYDASPALTQAWDVAVKTLAANPEHADKSYEWFLKEGHKNVLTEIRSQLGIKEGEGGRKGPDPSETAAKVKEALAGRKPKTPTKPVSLAGVPTAAQDNPSNDGEFAHLDKLEGDALELAVAKMSREQQDRWANA